MHNNKIAVLLMLGALAGAGATGCAAVVAGSAVGAGAMVAADSRTVGTMVDDEAIEQKSRGYLSNNREIYKKSKLDATSVNGILLLTGQCQDKEYIEYIVSRVKTIPEVKKVVNRIEMIEPLGMSDRSRDTWITTKVKTQLLFGDDINSGRFKVITENKAVYLIGLVNKSEANRAVNVARQIDGVKKVVRIFEFLEDVKPAPENAGAAQDVPAAKPAPEPMAPVETPEYIEDETLVEQPSSAPVVINDTANSSSPDIAGKTPGETAPGGSSDDTFIIE